MSASTLDEMQKDASTEFEIGREHRLGRMNDRSFGRAVELEPKSHTWLTVAAGAVVPLGLAGAAVAATYVTKHERVAMTAWVSLAVVGTAAVIAAAAVSRRRTVAVDRSCLGVKEADHNRNLERTRSRTI